MTWLQNVARLWTALSLPTGVLVGLILTEVALRPVASQGIPIERERDYTIKQYKEGLSTAHYASDDRRLTGQPLLPGASNILLLGDSFVWAVNVSDEETMGGQLESRLRRENNRVNIVQYGWGGVSIPEFVAVAERLIRQWNPTRVMVFLNRADLGSDPLRVSRTSEYRMDFDSDGNWKILHEPKHRENPRLGRLRERLTENSTVLNLLYDRYLHLSHATLIEWPWIPKKGKPAEKLDSRLADVPLASVQALKQAFGKRLLIAFDTDSTVGAATDERQDDPASEARFQEACRAEGVDCVCLAQLIRRGESRLNRYARGFHNTPPNGGHYNFIGHALVADALYDALLASGLGGQ